MNQGKQQSVPPPLNLRLELTEPNKTEGADEWSLEAIATVGQGKTSVPSQEVQFYFDGKAIDSPETTDGNGRATKSFPSIGKGQHTWEAQIAGTDIKSRQSRNFKGEVPKPKVVKLVPATAHLGLNVFTVSARATSENGMPVTGLSVSMVIAQTGEAFRPKTNKDGVATRKFALASGAPFMTIRISAPGTAGILRKTLYPQPS